MTVYLYTYISTRIATNVFERSALSFGFRTILLVRRVIEDANHFLRAQQTQNNSFKKSDRISVASNEQRGDLVSAIRRSDWRVIDWSAAGGNSLNHPPLHDNGRCPSPFRAPILSIS